jgi:hypothetical protein
MRVANAMTRRFYLSLFAFLLGVLGLFSATPARAQGPHVEFYPILEAAPGGLLLSDFPVTLSFDLPADYVVTDQKGYAASAESLAAVTDDMGELYQPAYISLFSGPFSSWGTPKEAAYEAFGEEDHGDQVVGPIMAEGPLTAGQFEGYWLGVRIYLDAEDLDSYYTELFSVVRVAGGDSPLQYAPPEPGGYYYFLLELEGDVELVDGIEQFLETGESVAQWNQRGFDAVVGSLSVAASPVAATPEAAPTREPVAATAEAPSPQGEDVESVDVGAPQPEFVQSVPGPDEISTDPGVIGSNILLALFVVFVFAFTSTLFNQTLEDNRREIEGWAGRFFKLFRRLSSLAQQRRGVLSQRCPWVQRVTGPAAILVLTGLVYGFLSPDFGLNTTSVVLFLSLAAAVGAVTYLYKGGQVLFTTGRFRLRAGVRLYVVALVIAAGCVLLSRLTDFQPGFLFGFVASYTLLTPAGLDRRQSGQIVFFPALALLAFSVAAWLLSMPLGDLREGSDAWWVALPQGAAVTVFVVGLEGLFFSMIPLRFMDGAKIAKWNRLFWFLIFGLAGFLFCWVLLNPGSAYVQAVRETRVITALSLLAFYSLITVGTWAYFRQRVKGRAAAAKGKH